MYGKARQKRTISADARRLPYLLGKLHRITKRGFTMIRIAIVEDDTGYRSQLGKYIDQYQSDFSETVSVSEFSDGLEIVEKYKSEYDIILMDIQMKHMDGMQAAMRIRDMDKISSLYLLQILRNLLCRDIRSRH